MRKKLSLKKKTISLIDLDEMQGINGGSVNCVTMSGCTCESLCRPCNSTGVACPGTGGGNRGYCGTGPCTSTPCGGTNNCTGVGCNSVQYTHCNC